MGLFRPKSECLPPNAIECAADARLYARQRDPIGDRFHFAFALLYLFCLSVSASAAAVAYAILGVYAALRLHCTWRACLFVLDRPLWNLMLLWTAWQALSILWSPDQSQGLDELSPFRAVAAILFLWPLFDRAALLVAAFLAGVFFENLVQALQGFGLLEARSGAGDRLTGLIHPIQTGALCAMAIFWHASAALRGRSSIRLLALIGGLSALLGLVLTGSRGPWISAAAAGSLGLLALLWKLPWKGRVLLLTAVTVSAVLVAVIPASRNLVTQRWERAVLDLSEAAEGQLKTDVGLRLANWQAALEVYRAHPVIGVGAGGFNEAVEETSRREEVRWSQHAHSLYAQVAATTGTIGLVLMGLVLIGGLVASVRVSRRGIFSGGTPFVLLSWWAGAAFDAYHHVGLLMGALTFAFALILAEER